MIVYNVTVKVDEYIEADWVAWMQNVHVPDVMATACFTSYRMSLIDPVQGDKGGNAYSIQYTSISREALTEYFENHAQTLQKDHIVRYGDKALAFRTIMEVVSEG